VIAKFLVCALKLSRRPETAYSGAVPPTEFSQIAQTFVWQAA
jgi:hypothetical protein